MGIKLSEAAVGIVAGGSFERALGKSKEIDTPPIFMR
jgi:hypothetical protein